MTTLLRPLAGCILAVCLVPAASARDPLEDSCISELRASGPTPSTFKPVQVSSSKQDSQDPEYVNFETRTIYKFFQIKPELENEYADYSLALTMRMQPDVRLKDSKFKSLDEALSYMKSTNAKYAVQAGLFPDQDVTAARRIDICFDAQNANGANIRQSGECWALATKRRQMSLVSHDVWGKPTEACPHK